MDEPTGSVRVGDVDRESAVVALREHAVAGRLTLEELAERVGSALTATTREQLEGALGSLPDTPAAHEEAGSGRVLGLFGDVTAAAVGTSAGA